MLFVLLQWEKQARAKRIGLWASSNPDKPWEWRKDKREGKWHGKNNDHPKDHQNITNGGGQAEIIRKFPKIPKGEKVSFLYLMISV